MEPYCDICDGRVGIDVECPHIDNPRRVAMEREMNAARDKLIHEQRAEIERLRGLLVAIRVLAGSAD